MMLPDKRSISLEVICDIKRGDDCAAEESATDQSPLPFVNFFQYPPLGNMASLDGSLKHLISAKAQTGSMFTSFISVPYCRVKCHSCPFFKELLPSREDQGKSLDDYVKWLLIQIKQTADTHYFDNASCAAVFLGGGTFSLLDPEQVDAVLNCFRQSFPLAPDIEITLEGNPREFSIEYVRRIKDAGVNRLSIGLQSFQEDVLRRIINSPHQAQASHASLQNALSVGFETINVDLLYRLPGQTFELWRKDLQIAVEYGAQSLTLYAYVVHDGSASAKLINRGFLGNQPSKDTEYDWYTWSAQFLKSHGYRERMKGNFSKSGHGQIYGRVSYLECSEIIGLGAGAYSFVNRHLFSSPKGASEYMDKVRAGTCPAVDQLSVYVTDDHLMRRYIIFNFFSSGFERKGFHDRFGVDPLSAFPEVFTKLKEQGLLQIDDKEIRLTEIGFQRRERVQFEFYRKW